MFKKNDLKKKIELYLRNISDKLPVNKVILYGSYANGKPDNNSDIDIAIISSKKSEKSFLDDLSYLWIEAAKVDTKIEPLLFSSLEEKNREPNSFLSEILRTGKVIYSK